MEGKKKQRRRKAQTPPTITKSLVLTKRVQLEMMEDRGYEVASKEWRASESVKIMQDAINKAYGDETAYNPFYVEYDGGATKPRIVVAFIAPSDKDTKINTARRRAITSLAAKQVDRVIFIYLPSKSNKKRLVPEVDIPYEEFESEALEINPYRTNYNDIYQPLTSTQRDMLCLRNKIRTDEMKGLSIHDATVRYLGLAIGTVVKMSIQNPLPMTTTDYDEYFEVRNVPPLYVATETELEEGEVSDEDVEPEEEEEGAIDTDASVFLA